VNRIIRSPFSGKPICENCGREIKNLPYICRRCFKKYCEDCRLPEYHHCIPVKPPIHNRLRSNDRPISTLPRNDPPKKHLTKHSKSVKGLKDNRKFLLLLIVFLSIGVGGFVFFNQPSFIDTIPLNYYTAPTSPLPTITYQPSSKIVNIDSILTTPTQPVTPKTVPQLVTSNSIEQVILQYTNNERRNYGLNPLKWDSQLAAMARYHSTDMGTNHYYSHVSLSGESQKDRLIKYGFYSRSDVGGAAENINYMPIGNIANIGIVTNDAESIGAAMVKSWMNSPGHRGNILDPNNDLIGIGVYCDGNVYYATQNFINLRI